MNDFVDQSSLYNCKRCRILFKSTKTTNLQFYGDSSDQFKFVVYETIFFPVNYNIVVNNLPTYVISKRKYFADDLKIYLNIRHSNIFDMSSDLSS